MPIEWLVETAHENDVAVYPILMAYYNNEQRHYHTRENATPDMMRAAVANYWAKGCDGMYTWFMQWPLGERQRRTLSELGDPALVAGGTKHYFVNRRTNSADQVGFVRPLPLEIAGADPAKVYEVPFYIADDCSSDSVAEVVLKVRMNGTVSADKLTMSLNGESLADETCLRSRPHMMFPYDTLFEFHLRDVLPKVGHNTFQISLDERPPKLDGSVSLDDLDLIVTHG